MTRYWVGISMTQSHTSKCQKRQFGIFLLAQGSQTWNLSKSLHRRISTSEGYWQWLWGWWIWIIPKVTLSLRRTFLKISPATQPHLTKYKSIQMNRWKWMVKVVEVGTCYCSPSRTKSPLTICSPSTHGWPWWTPAPDPALHPTPAPHVLTQLWPLDVAAVFSTTDWFYWF